MLKLHRKIFTAGQFKFLKLTFCLLFMTYITLTKAVCVMFLRERSMRGQCMRTWSSSGSQSGIAERVLRPPGGEEVTCFRRGTSVDEGLRSLKDCVGRRPEYAATKENKPQ